MAMQDFSFKNAMKQGSTWSGHLECPKLVGALVCHPTRTYHTKKMSKVILLMSSCTTYAKEHEQERDLEFEFDFMGPLVNQIHEEVRLSDSSQDQDATANYDRKV
jgi:hypothetical protein